MLKKSIVSAMALVLTSITPAYSADFELTMTTSSMENHPVNAQSVIPMSKRFSELTGGRVNITFFNPGTLCPELEIFPSIAKGVVDMGYSAISRMPQKFTATAVVELPYFGDNSRVLGAALYSYYLKSPELQQEFEGYKPLMICGSTPRDILSIKPIRTLADLKGKKVGTNNATGAEIVTLLGAVPVVTANTDMYMSLQRGMLDAVLMPIPTYRSLKITEVAKYLTRCRIAPTTTPLVMNKKIYESFPPEIKKVCDEIYGLPSTLHATRYVDQSTEDDLAWIIKNHNVEIIELQKGDLENWHKALYPLTERWKERVTKKGFDADKIYREVKELVDFYSANDMAEWKKEYAKHKDILGNLY